MEDFNGEFFSGENFVNSESPGSDSDGHIFIKNFN